ATLRKSVQALFVVTPDTASAEKMRERIPSDRGVVGTVAEINEAIEEYCSHGFDEVCVPDFTMGGSLAQRRENYEAFASGVCANFR
ncbi:MAG: hypothetical protein ACKOFF_09220, partial [Acidimicrobiales bacterium]